MGALRVVVVEERPVRFASARAHAVEVEGMLSGAMTRKPHSDVEEFLDEKGREWARRMYEEHLALRAELEQRTEVVVGSDGVERSSSRVSARHLESVLGRVEVPRLAYQSPGCTDLHPMDAALNLPREMFSHGIRRMVAKEAARASFDEVVDIVRDVALLRPVGWSPRYAARERRQLL
jgi:hypothetical protein